MLVIDDIYSEDCGEGISKKRFTPQSVLNDAMFSHLLEVEVCQDDFISALDDVSPSITPHMERHYSNLRKRFSS